MMRPSLFDNWLTPLHPNLTTPKEVTMNPYENHEESQMLRHIDELLREDQPSTVIEQNGRLEITKNPTVSSPYTPNTMSPYQLQTMSNKNSFFERG